MIVVGLALTHDHTVAIRLSDVVRLDKCCIDQNNIDAALQCLPVFEMACKRMLVLCGETYTTRLWCIWELYTFFSMSSDVARMQVRHLNLRLRLNFVRTG